eukprot:5752004-Karenia_brevis.AAC.1
MHQLCQKRPRKGNENKENQHWAANTGNKFVTTQQLSEALAEFRKVVAQGIDKQLQDATSELLQKVAKVVEAQ